MTKPERAVPFAISQATGVPALPLTFGQVLDRVYLLTRANLRLFLRVTTIPALLCIVFSLPFAVTGAELQRQSGHPPTWTRGSYWLLAADAVSLLLIALLSPLYEAAASYAAVQSNAGVAVTAAEAWRITLKRTGHFVWLAILRGLVAAGPMIVACIALEGAIFLVQMRTSRGESSNAAFIFLGIALLLYLASGVYALVVSVRLVLAYPASVAENLTAWKSVVRSNRLAKGAGLRIFLGSFLAFAITHAIWLVVLLILAAFTVAGVWVIIVFHLSTVPLFLWLGAMGLILLVSAFFWIAFYWTAFETCAAAIYHDQLLRKEGVAPAPVRFEESRNVAGLPTTDARRT